MNIQRQQRDKKQSNVTVPLKQTPTVICDLPVADKLIVAGQPQFGVFSQVLQVNYLDYRSYLLSQKPVANWRKQLKVNQFAFIQLIHPPYRICIAVATIKLATTAFSYIYYEQTQQLELVEALQPLTWHSSFIGDHQQGEIRFEHAKLFVEMNFTSDMVALKLASKPFAIEACLARGNNPLAVCSPSGRRGWTFTQKEPFTATSGRLSFNKHSKHKTEVITHDKALTTIEATNAAGRSIEFSQQTLANLDWTLGFMRHETNWFWSCINSRLSDNRHFTLNLSMGVNEAGTSENACWIDGDIYHLPPVMFQRGSAMNSNESGVNKHPQWTVKNQNLGWSRIEINLSFTPIKVYKKTDNYGMVASIFEQWIGLYSGYIKIGDDKIVLEKVMGLAEDHFAKW